MPFLCSHRETAHVPPLGRLILTSMRSKMSATKPQLTNPVRTP